MTDLAPETRPRRAPLVERRIRRVANARSVTIGLAVTFLGLAFVGALVMRLADQHNFPSLGIAFWWAIQTVTTVGYGDVVPKTAVGRVVGGLEMVLGVSFIAFLTAGVTSTVIQRSEAGARDAEYTERQQEIQAVVDGLAQIRTAIGDLDRRLDRIEQKRSC